jgi:hypothetical protein
MDGIICGTSVFIIFGHAVIGRELEVISYLGLSN